MPSIAIEALAAAVAVAATVGIVVLDSTIADVVSGAIVAAAGIVFAWAIARSTADTGEPPSPSSTRA
jgi:Co/Zn/Cd efflux system component